MGRGRKATRSKETWKKREVKDVSTDDSTRSAPMIENLEKNFKSSEQPRLLDIYARLALPFVRLDENNLPMYSDDEETIEFKIRPRLIFSANMCLVCMKNADSRFTCEKCKMTYYCTIEHRDDNRADHEALCNVLTREFNGIEAFSSAMKISSGDAYRSLRIKMIDRAEEKLRRSLDLWEREIILYPRVCRICRKIGDKLIDCRRCIVDFHCNEHADRHDDWCKDFQVFHRLLWLQHSHGCASIYFPDIARHDCRPIAKNFDALMGEIFDFNANYRLIDAHTYASMSLVATAPLTALYALENTCEDWKTRESLAIDVVGAEFTFECANLRVWEKLFLHYLPKLRNLYLRFNGPELHLPDAPIELLTRIPLCGRCRNAKRRIIVVFDDSKLYHEIDDDTRAGPSADLICLFNPGLYRDTGYNGTDTWPRTIVKFCHARVPVIVTSYTEIEIPRDIRRIQSIGRVEIMLEPRKNPFASVKPDRNFVSDDAVPLMYKNYCISVVRGL